MSIGLLSTLAGSPAGRDWLCEQGVYTDPDRFGAALRPPTVAGAAELVGLQGGRPLVYVGQQVAADFAHATAAKFAAAEALAAAGESDYLVIWHDMDRADSDRFMIRIALELGTGKMGAWLADRKLAHGEPRFIPADRRRLVELFERAASVASGLPKADRAKAIQRLDALRAALEQERLASTADAARVIGARLLREQVGVDLPWTYVSTLASGGLLDDVVLELLSVHAEVIAAYNAAVQSLQAEGLDPHVHELGQDWLPLWWNCPASGRRLRLIRETAGSDVYGTAECPCGESHRFHLGTADAPSLHELQATGRWSPDVLLPVLVDRLFSGYVAGQSSALYGIVMRRVLRDALGQQPTPSFLPQALTSQEQAPAEPDSLLHAYLLG